MQLKAITPCDLGVKLALSQSPRVYSGSNGIRLLANHRGLHFDIEKIALSIRRETNPRGKGMIEPKTLTFPRTDAGTSVRRLTHFDVQKSTAYIWDTTLPRQSNRRAKTTSTSQSKELRLIHDHHPLSERKRSPHDSSDHLRMKQCPTKLSQT